MRSSTGSISVPLLNGLFSRGTGWLELGRGADVDEYLALRLGAALSLNDEALLF